MEEHTDACTQTQQQQKGPAGVGRCHKNFWQVLAGVSAKYGVLVDPDRVCWGRPRGRWALVVCPTPAHKHTTSHEKGPAGVGRCHKSFWRVSAGVSAKYGMGCWWIRIGFVGGVRDSDGHGRCVCPAARPTAKARSPLANRRRHTALRVTLRRRPRRERTPRAAPPASGVVGPLGAGRC